MLDSVMPARSAAGRGAGRRGLRSALTTVVRSITVAAGVFAPGHLGELTRRGAVDETFTESCLDLMWIAMRPTR